MKEKINEEVSVVMVYKASKKQALPYKIIWQNKEYVAGKMGYTHSYMEGRERQHIFEFADIDQTIWFRMRLDCSNLHWTLEAVHDGLAT